MTRARGQPSRTLLNRKYPHQVLVLAENIREKTFDRAIAFHSGPPQAKAVLAGIAAMVVKRVMQGSSRTA
jgi:hypothetical protein